MKAPRKWSLYALVAAGALGCVLFFAWPQGNGSAALVAASTPPVPAAAARLSEELAFRLEAATERALAGEEPVTALADLSRLYHGNGFLAEAMQCYEGLVALEPGEPRWWHRYATILASYGYLEDAIPLWREAIALAPDYLPARIRLGDALLKARRFEEAREVYARARRLEAANPYILLGLGRWAIAQEDWEQAMEFLEGAAEASDYRIGADLLISAYQRLGMEQKALVVGRVVEEGAFSDLVDPWIEELSLVCYEPQQLATTGGMAIFRGAHERGLALLRRAVELAPEDAYYHYQLGMALLEADQPEAATKAFQETVERKPDLADGWLRLIELSRTAGLPGRARSLIEEGMLAAPDSPSMHIAMAEALAAEGRVSAAREHLERSAELRPNEAIAYLHLVRLHLSQGRLSEAVAAAEQALRVEPGNVTALSLLTFRAIEEGAQERAAELLGRLQLHPRVAVERVEEAQAAFRARFGEAPPS
ncbi:MAG: tetratricopeptide repeat protein [Opitutales bacterium]